MSQERDVIPLILTGLGTIAVTVLTLWYYGYVHFAKEEDALLLAEQPEAMLVLGDTNSCLSVIPAKRRKVPIFHMEAGNRCFDMRVPEEINRRIVDHTADINLTYSTIARDYLLREGLPPDQVIKTGSPMFEVLNHYRAQIDASDVLQRLELTQEGYFVVSAHREENIESERSFTKLVAVLNAVAEDHGLPVVVSTHPRTQKRIDATGAQFHPLVRLLKPLGFHDYVNLQMRARAGRPSWLPGRDRAAPPVAPPGRCVAGPRPRAGRLLGSPGLLR